MDSLDRSARPTRSPPAAGLPHVMIELRQDLIDTPAGVAAWADRLAGIFARLRAEEGLFTWA